MGAALNRKSHAFFLAKIPLQTSLPLQPRLLDRGGLTEKQEISKVLGKEHRDGLDCGSAIHWGMGEPAII